MLKNKWIAAVMILLCVVLLISIKDKAIAALVIMPIVASVVVSQVLPHKQRRKIIR